MIERISVLTGTGVPVRGDNIDTDRIIPARFLRSVTFEGLEAHLFEDDRVQADAKKPGSHPLSDPRYAAASILLANANFGCGSSREHAPQAIRRHGFRAVLAESFSEIFFGNSVALGLPCVTARKEDVESLMAAVEANPSTTLTIDLDREVVTIGSRSIGVRLPGAARDSFLKGTWDATALLLDHFEQVEQVAARLPYVRGWS